MRPDSIRGRLTLWYVVALAIALILVEIILFLNFREMAIQSVDQRLKATIDPIVYSLNHPEPGGVEEEISEATESSPVASNSQEIELVVFDGRGHRLHGSPNSKLVQFVPNIQREEWRVQGSKEWARRVYTVRIGEYVVEAALPWEPIKDSLDRLGLLLTVLFVAFMSLAGAGGWILIGAALRPIEAITDTANQIHADNLSERLPANASDREIRGLVGTLNAMIERIAAAFESQRRFTADASHELRTPITILQNEVEVALSRPRETEEYRRILENVLEESKRMAHLVNDLLFLARSDALREALQPVDVPLDDLCKLVLHEFQSQAKTRGVTLKAQSITEGLTVPGDPERLRCLLENLVDNAIKYTPPPGEVTVSLYREDDQAVMGVKNTGPGIAADHLPRLFERFYRVDKSRSRALGGSGLGLAICEQIVRLHGGHLTVESAPNEGCRFLIRLPNAHQELDLAEQKPELAAFEDHASARPTS